MRNMNAIATPAGKLSAPMHGYGGVFGGAFMYLIMRSYVELVRVIVDMLLPK